VTYRVLSKRLPKDAKAALENTFPTWEKAAERARALVTYQAMFDVVIWEV